MQNSKLSPSELLTLMQKLLNGRVPTESILALGKAIAVLNFDDWKKVSTNIFIKDIKPIFKPQKRKAISLKELGGSLKNTLKSAANDIPQVTSRLGQFSKKIVGDYNQLKSSEERGNYILRLSLYSSIFALAFQKGAKQKMLSRSTVSLVILGMIFVFINRLLEQAESKLEDNAEALKLSRDLRSLLRTMNTGVSSGMNFGMTVGNLAFANIEIQNQAGETIGNLSPKSMIDNMIYTALLSLFSNPKT